MAEVSFGEWLRRQRKYLGFTQEQLAKQVSCSTIALRKIEAETRRPSEQIAARLADIFNISPNERPAFLRFARGHLKSVPSEQAKDTPWNISSPASHSNLPATVTSLIGRQQEISDLHKYLQRADIRLVTLIGPPGIGKTRLSLEAARTSIADFHAGVFFVALAPLNDAALLVSTIVQALDFVEAKDASTLDLLINDIGNKQILLVLDNCEHLIEDIALLVSGLLSACSGLTILTTSREALHVPGEWLYPVQPLNLPKESQPVDVDTAAQFAALTLFTERARAVRPDFALNADNLQAVASVCIQLDGLPLAIELLAARMRLMSPQALLERMTGRFVLSADGMRAVAARQKTLNNAIGWSYNSLPPEEQKLFIRLSVFSGGFTLEVAETIYSDLFTDRPVSDLVALLSDKSLLQRNLDERGEVRFSMLVTIQQFARDILRRIGDEARTRDLHLAYFLSMAEIGEREIRGPRQVEWVDRIQSEQNNMRAALEWAVSSQKTESALRLLCALGWPWEIRGHYNEARNWLHCIRTLPNAGDYPLPLSGALNHIGRYNWTQEQFLEARAMLEESRAISTSLGIQGEKRLAEALNWLGLLEIGNDINVARPLLEQGLELNKKCNDAWGTALSTFHLGILESNSAHKDKALMLLEESLAMFQQFGDLFFISRVSIFLGYLFLDQEQYDQTRQLFEQHLAIDTQLHFWDGIAEGWRDLGNLAHRQGDLEQAEKYYEQSRLVCREHGLVKTIP